MNTLTINVRDERFRAWKIEIMNEGPGRVAAHMEVDGACAGRLEALIETMTDASAFTLAVMRGLRVSERTLIQVRDAALDTVVGS